MNLVGVLGHGFSDTFVFGDQILSQWTETIQTPKLGHEPEPESECLTSHDIWRKQLLHRVQQNVQFKKDEGESSFVVWTTREPLCGILFMAFLRY